jgi:transposase
VAPGKKNARRLGAHLVFLDESGFQLTPLVRRTWAPRGCTPLLRHWQRHDRVSILSSLSLSPGRRHCGLYFRCQLNENFHASEVVLCLRDLLRHLRGPVIVLLDNAKIHRGPLLAALCRRHPRLRLVYFPSYAPELNPAEGIWARAKTELANGQPPDGPRLLGDVTRSLSRLARSQSHLRGCITHALSIRLP